MWKRENLHTPESLGFNRCRESELDGGNTPEDAARIFDAVMEGTATEAQKNVVIVNAAFAIRVIRPEKPIEECIALARRITGKRQGTGDFKEICRTKRIEKLSPIKET